MLKKSLLISSALLLSLSFPSKNMAMMDDGDNPSNLSARPATVQTEQGKTSKALPRTRRASEDPKSIRRMLGNKHIPFYKKLEDVTHLPEKEKNEWLVNQLRNKDLDVADHIKTALVLPEADQNRIAALYAIAQNQGVDEENRLEAAENLPKGKLFHKLALSIIAQDANVKADTRIKAAKKLPKDNKVRIDTLSAIVQNQDEKESSRLKAAETLPKDNEARITFFSAIAQSHAVDEFIRIKAAKKLPKDNPVRVQVLKELKEK